jgi:hypothetical protein
MLTSLPTVASIPGMQKFLVTGQQAYLQTLLAAADQAIKSYCKRDLEYTSYTEYHSGNDWPDLILKQRPIKQGDVAGVWVDPNGYAGQGTNNPFGPGTLLTLGTNYYLELDSTLNGVPSSARGMLKLISGGNGWPWYGFYPVGAGWGKLSGSKLPGWPRGDGNIKVQYSAGYQVIPSDLSLACAEIVAYMVRTVPLGSALSSENLGAYSYSVVSQTCAGTIPELGTSGMILRSYRERQI